MIKQITLLILLISLIVGLVGCIEEDTEINNKLTTNQLKENIQISTDKLEYNQGETVKVTIKNENNEDVKIYCPMVCSLGNFPTTVEILVTDKWINSGVYCPFELGLGFSDGGEDDYIYHILPAKDSFEINLRSFYERENIIMDEIVRVVYYLNNKSTPIYSNNFTIKAKNEENISRFFGSWILNVQEYIFNSNGTFQYLRYPLCGTPPVENVYEINGVYSIKKGELTLFFQNNLNNTIEWKFNYTFSNNNFTLSLKNYANGFVENFTKKVTFLVQHPNSNISSYNISINNISIPLDESDAVQIYSQVVNEIPGDININKKRENGWLVYYGNPVYGTGILINEVNMTIGVYSGY